MKLSIMKFSPVSCSFLPHRPAHLSQHPILKHPQFMFFP